MCSLISSKLNKGSCTADEHTALAVEAVSISDDGVNSSTKNVWPHPTSPLFALLAVTLGLGVLLRLLVW